jgi:hypothetical protein
VKGVEEKMGKIKGSSKYAEADMKEVPYTNL